MIFSNVAQNRCIICSPFCKFNILSSSRYAHVLKRRIDPDELALLLPFLFFLLLLLLLQRLSIGNHAKQFWKCSIIGKTYARLLSVLKARAVSILQGLLISCNQMSAEYLFMTDKLYDVRFDTGDKVIQCGRHNDIFKLWLQWRAKVQSPIAPLRKPVLFYFPHFMSTFYSSD